LPVRRSKLEINLEVLSVVKEGVDKPTRIMYAANLSWQPTQRVLNNLVGQGFLREITAPNNNTSRRRYKITEKGLNVLAYFDGAATRLGIEGIASHD
jgi:predicted transcriptional regulator